MTIGNYKEKEEWPQHEKAEQIKPALPIPWLVWRNLFFDLVHFCWTQFSPTVTANDGRILNLFSTIGTSFHGS
ncbi:MAG: hypothetical protein MN733_28030 [Nitrososphaera sp.]|nr:hypothetical protein [Nitrososphaera sp.]